MSFEMSISEIMDKEPLIVDINDDFASVAHKMTENDKETVIIMDGNDVKGVLKFTDICFAIKTFILGRLFMEKIPPEILTMQINELMQNPKLKEIFEKCGFIANCPPVSIGETNTVADAISIMASSGLDRLVVRRA